MKIPAWQAHVLLSCPLLAFPTHCSSAAGTKGLVYPVPRRCWYIYRTSLSLSLPPPLTPPSPPWLRTTTTIKAECAALVSICVDSFPVFLSAIVIAAQLAAHDPPTLLYPSVRQLRDTESAADRGEREAKGSCTTRLLLRLGVTTIYFLDLCAPASG